MTVGETNIRNVDRNSHLYKPCPRSPLHRSGKQPRMVCVDQCKKDCALNQKKPSWLSISATKKCCITHVSPFSPLHNLKFCSTADYSVFTFPPLQRFDVRSLLFVSRPLIVTARASAYVYFIRNRIAFRLNLFGSDFAA